MCNFCHAFPQRACSVPVYIKDALYINDTYDAGQQSSHPKGGV